MSELFLNQTKILTSADIPSSYWNMFDGTADFSGKNWNSLEAYTDDSWKSPNGNQCRQRKGSRNGLSKNIYLYAGKNYTISVAAFVDRNSSNNHINIYGNNLDISQVISHSGQPILSLKDAPNDWITLHFTFTVPKNDIYYVRFESEDDQVNIHWADLMLNEGVVPLAWNYSLNDFKSKIK